MSTKDVDAITESSLSHSHVKDEDRYPPVQVVKLAVTAWLSLSTCDVLPLCMNVLFSSPPYLIVTSFVPHPTEEETDLEVKWLTQCPQCKMAELSLALENGFYLLVKNANLFRLVQNVLFYNMGFYVTREWAREIAQWLPALALAEGPDFVLNTQWWLQTSVAPSPGNLMPFDL